MANYERPWNKSHMEALHLSTNGGGGRFGRWDGALFFGAILVKTK